MRPAHFYMNQNRRIILSLCCALTATLFMFYIDEGYYNFNWMLKPGNWIPFFIYAGAILGIQLIFTEVILGNFNGQVKTMSSIIISAGILILMMLAFA